MSLTDKHSGCADPVNCVGCVTAPGTKYEGHTPGPWKWVAYPQSKRTFIRPDRPGELDVAEVRLADSAAVNSANLTLLTDAAKLLGWCIAAKALLEDLSWTGLSISDDERDHRDTRQELLDNCPV